MTRPAVIAIVSHGDLDGEPTESYRILGAPVPQGNTITHYRLRGDPGQRLAAGIPVAPRLQRTGLRLGGDLRVTERRWRDLRLV